MVELNNRDRTINVKIIYYGPAVGGKTTNIQMLHSHAVAQRRGELVSVNSAQDRTIMFDLLPLKASGFRGFDLKLQLVAVPGQAMYAAIRKLAVRNVDSLVFVANSAMDRQQENIASFREMTGNLVTQHVDPATLPLVFQYNKRDLPEILDLQSLDRTLNARMTTAVPAVAVRGEGVLETFQAILTLTVTDLARRYRLMDMGKGQSVEDWAQAAILGIFGTSTFYAADSPPPEEPPPALGDPLAAPREAPPPERRTIRVALSSDVSAASSPDARANEALVESYAEAANVLSTTTQELREERDQAQRRLADILQVLEVARMLKPGGSADPVLAVALECLAQEVEAAGASFLVKDPTKGIRLAAQRGLREDPVLGDAASIALLPGLFDVPSAHVFDAEQNPELVEMLLASDPPFGSVVCVAFTAHNGVGGLALLYLTPNAARPSPERLSHLAALMRILAPFLMMPPAAPPPTTSAPAPPVAAAPAAPPTSAPDLLGTACRLAATPLLEALLSLRQQQADLRRRPGAPPWLAEGFAHMAGMLGDSVAFARAFQAFDRGELERERVEVAELTAGLAGGTVRCAPGVDTTTIAAQPILLRLALQALINAMRDQSETVEVRCTVEHGHLVTRVGVPGAGAELGEDDPRVLFAAEVIRQHGGQLGMTADSAGGHWATFDVPTV